MHACVGATCSIESQPSGCLSCGLLASGVWIRHCIALHGIVLFCIVLYCIVLSGSAEASRQGSCEQAAARSTPERNVLTGENVHW